MLAVNSILGLPVTIIVFGLIGLTYIINKYIF